MSVLCVRCAISLISVCNNCVCVYESSEAAYSFSLATNPSPTRARSYPLNINPNPTRNPKVFRDPSGSGRVADLYTKGLIMFLSGWSLYWSSRSWTFPRFFSLQDSAFIRIQHPTMCQRCYGNVPLWQWPALRLALLLWSQSRVSECQRTSNIYS